MKKKISLHDAVEIAKDEDEYGIMTAVEDLRSLGYNCRLYFRVMNKEKNWDNDDLNIKMRDKLYKKLGIYDTLEIAYKIVSEGGIL